MRPRVLGFVSALLDRHREAGQIDLNDIDEVIGEDAVSDDEVDFIVERLEAEGLSVGEPPEASALEAMRAVVAAARALSADLGRRPTVDEIASAVGRPPHAVRRALEQASAPPRRRPL